MKRGDFFLKGMLALALVFGLVLAGCENGTQEVTGTVSITKIDDPQVTAKTIAGGVMLSWPPIIDAYSYEVWRSGGEQPAALLLTTYGNGDSDGQNQDGIFEYFDIVSFQNDLKPAAEYTYTVLATSLGVKDIGKCEKVITTGTFPAQGSQAAAPADVKLEIDYGTKSISVTVTPPTTGNIPNAYWIGVEKIGSYSNISYDQWVTHDPAAPLVWTVYGDPNNAYYVPQERNAVYNMLQTRGGEFRVTVEASLGNHTYFKVADQVIAEKKVDPLFGSGSYLSVSSPNPITGTGTSSDTVLGYYASINLNSISPQPGVTYTIERATLDDMNKPGAFTAVTLSKDSDKNTAVSLTVDIFGNLSATTVYDRSLPVTKAKYQYRVKAVKDGITDYSETRTVSTNPQSYISPSISVAAKTASGNDVTFAITPSVNYKGLLQANDKLVLYWLIGDSYDCYQTGPYTTANSISFSKAELEAATVASKNLTVPANTSATTKYLYVQAYLEFANGDKIVISGGLDYYGYGWGGTGLYSGSYYPGTTYNGQYHVQLDY